MPCGTTHFVSGDCQLPCWSAVSYTVCRDSATVCITYVSSHGCKLQPRRPNTCCLSTIVEWPQSPRPWHGGIVGIAGSMHCMLHSMHCAVHCHIMALCRMPKRLWHTCVSRLTALWFGAAEGVTGYSSRGVGSVEASVSDTLQGVGHNIG